MDRRAFFVSLLVAAICVASLSLPIVNSQTATITTTVTITQPASGQCTERTIPFYAQAGKEVIGTYGSDVQIDFYILSSDQLNLFQNCILPASARPLFVEVSAVGHGNDYRSLPFPVDGTYYFVVIYRSGPTSLVGGYATVELTYPASLAILGSTTTLPSTTTTGTLSTVITLSTSSTTQSSSLLAFGNFGTIGAVALVAIIALVGSVVLFTKRKKAPQTTVAVEQSKPPRTEPLEQIPHPAVIPATAVSGASSGLSTGYNDLDGLLVGGLPEGYAVLLLSPPCDERDLLLRKIIGSALSSQMVTFYVSNDPSRVQDLVGRYWKDFYALSPQADKILSPPANLYKISPIDNLSDLNISLTKTLESRVKQGAAKRLIILDLLTDILLQHKALTARKWLSDFIAKRKAEGFTIVASLNPLVTAKEESQTVIDIFDGVIEIYEKELRERSRRFLVVKRMFGRRYSESELMLDKDKLF